MIQLVWSSLRNRSPETGRIEQFAADELDFVPEVLGGPQRVSGGATDHTDHPITPVEQQLGEKRPILTGDAGHQRPQSAAGSHP